MSKKFILEINADPKKYISVAKMLIKHRSLFGEDGYHFAHKAVREFKVYKGHAYCYGTPVNAIEINDINDITKELIILDWCKNHKIEVKVENKDGGHHIESS